MTAPVKNPFTRLPIVIRQAWVTIAPDGAVYPAGYSYHLTEPNRVAMISEVASRLSADVQDEREEPVGAPESVHTTEEFHQKIRATPHGLRVR